MINDYDFFTLAFIFVPVMSLLAWVVGLKKEALISIAIFGVGALAFALCVYFDVFSIYGWGEMLIATFLSDIISFVLAGCIIVEVFKKMFNKNRG